MGLLAPASPWIAALSILILPQMPVLSSNTGSPQRRRIYIYKCQTGVRLGSTGLFFRRLPLTKWEVGGGVTSTGFPPHRRAVHPDLAHEKLPETEASIIRACRQPSPLSRNASRRGISPFRLSYHWLYVRFTA